MSTNNINIYDYQSEATLIAEQIIQQIEQGAEDWEMPWHKGMSFALNRVTGSLYGGINLMLLWDECKKHNYSKNHWATLKQWRKLGGTVRKGEKAIRILVLIQRTSKEEAQLNLHPEMATEGGREFRTFIKHIPVFNIDQVNGLNLDQPGLFPGEVYGTAGIDELIKKTGAEIRHGGNEAFYRPSEDFIQMPYKASFHETQYSTAVEGYYTTLLHELIHWTGHESRCDRQKFAVFGSEMYAFEELVAELGCAMLSTHFQQRIEPRAEHAQYIADWLKVLKQDFNYFYQAQNQALNAISWLFSHTGILELELKARKNTGVKEKHIEDWAELISNEALEIDNDLFFETKFSPGVELQSTKILNNE